MEGVRAYLLAVVIAAIFCGFVKSLGKVTGRDKMVQLLCGLFLLFTAVSPLTGIRWDALTEWIPEIQLQTQTAVNAGTELSSRAMAERIMQETQAYILDKAAQLGMDIRAEVGISRSQPMVPETVTIRGDFSIYQKTQLSDLIAKDLGIKKEAQRWNP